MNYFNVKGFRKAHKPNPKNDLGDKPVPSSEELKIENRDDLTKSAKADPAGEIGEDEDDDFILNEVKRRMKELRRNSFMVLIPEESGQEEEEEEETSSSEWRGSVVEDCCFPCGFNELYKTYCERMLYFDRMSAQQLHIAGSRIHSSPSTRSASKKLTSSLLNLSFKKQEEPQDDGESLQQQQDDPYQDLETAYVAHICLTWEVLQCQYMQLSQKISSQPENPTSYSHAAQRYQQFEVFLQRFIENEPFEQGLRVEIYARVRNSFPQLLQVPSIQGSDEKENEAEKSYSPVLASNLIKIIEGSIRTFYLFMKTDKKKSGTVINLFGGQNQITGPLQQIQSSLEKKKMKLKELFKKKGWKKSSLPAMLEGVELLFGLIDIKVISRTLRMVRISMEQLLWCEEKLSKLDLSENKLKRDGSPILFPC